MYCTKPAPPGPDLGELPPAPVEIPKVLSHRSPAAVASTAAAAFDPPCPCTVNVPIVSEPTDTLWLSKGPPSASAPLSSSKDKLTVKPPSVSPEPAKLTLLAIATVLPVAF